MSEPWWKSAVVYQIYPRSFADHAANGIGSLEGIRRQLDHLSWLGVDAIWLSPFYRSPMADFGYDVSDYRDVDPLFGTLADFDALVADVHERGMKIIVDWVPNHSSDQHPWFIDSRSSRDAEHRDWYIWRDSAPDGGPPNNWIETWGGGPAWTFDDTTGQWYLRLFLPEQPDLNWSNPEVRDAMAEVLRFWLDRGVDGFRVDVMHALGKDSALHDDPPEFLPIPHSALHHDPAVTMPIVTELRSVLEEYDGDRMMVAEVFLLDMAMVASYYGEGEGVHLAFNFPPLFTPWDAQMWLHQIEEVHRVVAPQGWPTWVLSNHDQPRHATRYGTEERARAAAVLLLGLRGTPFLYAGEELGLRDAEVPPERIVDPGGRDGCRAPIPWDPSPDHGWGTIDPWLPWPPEPEKRNVEVCREDPSSILHLYRRILAERASSSALSLGDQVLLDAPAGMVAFERTHTSGDRRRVLVNFTSTPIEAPTGLLDGWTVSVSTHADTEGCTPTLLRADEALIARPSKR